MGSDLYVRTFSLALSRPELKIFPALPPGDASPMGHLKKKEKKWELEGAFNVGDARGYCLRSWHHL